MRPHNRGIERNNHYRPAAACTLTNTAQYVAGLCHCQPTFNLSCTWVQGSSPETRPLASLHCCTGIHMCLHWPLQGSSCQAISPGSTEWWLPAGTEQLGIIPVEIIILVEIMLQPITGTIKTPNSSSLKSDAGRMPLSICYQMAFPSVLTSLWALATQPTYRPPCRSFIWSISHQPEQKATWADHVKHLAVL